MNRNKLTKRVLAGMMSAAMLAAMPVYAANEDSMIVNYSQGNTYMLNIPKSIDLSSTEGKTVENIGVSAVNTTPTQKVQVKIKSGITDKNQVELVRQDDADTKVVSDVTDKDGNKVSNGFVVAEFQNTSTTPITTGTGVLNFSAVKDSADGTVKAGSYSGTIVFEADVVGRIETSETF